MKKINLLNRKGKKAMTLAEFKTWLNNLVVSKKGALPDLTDWKNIKETLDKVRAEPIQNDLDLSGYPIPVHDYDNTVEPIEISYLGYDMNLLEDIEYFLGKNYKIAAILTTTYNGVDVILDETYETKEIKEHLTRDNSGR